jgi:hypothetical protein
MKSRQERHIIVGAALYVLLFFSVTNFHPIATFSIYLFAGYYFTSITS